MTATYRLPESISSQIQFRSKPVNARAIRVIIPTYQDWEGLKVTLDSLLNLETPPMAIAVANDNPDKDIPAWLDRYPVTLINYPGNLGPAKARNFAFGFRHEFPQNDEQARLAEVIKLLKGTNTPDYWRNGFCADLKWSGHAFSPTGFYWAGNANWVYFTDCGCTHDRDLFLKFEKTWVETGDCCVAISGPVTGSGSGAINEYMTEQGVLNPPLEKDIHGVYIPQAIITANALIACLPFAFLGGFDPEFKEAAGEDLDMGIRLRQLGVIAWSPDAKIAHRFDEDEKDFYNRFRRYGRGNRKLEIKHGLPCLRARPFTPDKAGDPEHLRLAKVAVEAMQAGYDDAVVEGDRGVLKVLPGHGLDPS